MSPELGDEGGKGGPWAAARDEAGGPLLKWGQRKPSHVNCTSDNDVIQKHLNGCS